MAIRLVITIDHRKTVLINKNNERWGGKQKSRFPIIQHQKMSGRRPSAHMYHSVVVSILNLEPWENALLHAVLCLHRQTRSVFNELIFLLFSWLSGKELGSGFKY